LTHAQKPKDGTYTYSIAFEEWQGKSLGATCTVITIPNSPSIEIRFTDTSNKKTIFYFDLIRFDGENITGKQSRFMSAFKKTIPISSVKKIEVQNGKKNFRYVK